MPEGIKYQILRADIPGCPPLDGAPQFDDPEVASKVARIRSRELGEKLMVKAILNTKWHDRENLRMRDGTYNPIPWGHHDWWNSPQATAIHRHHFTHPSVEQAGWVAYTKTTEDGMKDKQTTVRPGSYLKQFSHIMEKYGISERQVVNIFNAEYAPIEVKFASTEDEIIKVYEHGPDTCMKGRRWPKDGRNPAYIYAAGDLQVAYLGDLDDHPSARTLVWPERKTYSRVYGDIARITKGLERLGYKWGAPIGAKVKKVKLKEVKFDPTQTPPHACFLAPYIDKQNMRGGGHLAVIDKGTHLEICEEGALGSHHCGLPDGYSGYYVPRADEYPTFTCEVCGTGGHRELLTVHVDVEDDEEQAWCPKCVKKGTFQCGYSGRHCAKATVKFAAVEGAYWAMHYIEMYAAKCEVSGRLCHEDHLIRIHFADGKSKMVNTNWARDNGMFRSTISRKYFLGDQRANVYFDGGASRHTVGKSELKDHAFQCEAIGCGIHYMLPERERVDDKLYCPGCFWAMNKKPVKDQPKAEAKPKKPLDALRLKNEMAALQNANQQQLNQYRQQLYQADEREPRF